MTILTNTLAKIRELNDNCRQGLDRNARITITSTCLATFAPDGGVHEIIAQAGIMKAVRQFRFAADANCEHDFGRIEVGDHVVLFKIDYYDLDLTFDSEDPANAGITRRVMTIMLPSDY